MALSCVCVFLLFSFCDFTTSLGWTVLWHTKTCAQQRVPRTPVEYELCVCASALSDITYLENYKHTLGRALLVQGGGGKTESCRDAPSGIRGSIQYIYEGIIKSNTLALARPATEREAGAR